MKRFKKTLIAISITLLFSVVLLFSNKPKEIEAVPVPATVTGKYKLWLEVNGQTSFSTKADFEASGALNAAQTRVTFDVYIQAIGRDSNNDLPLLSAFEYHLNPYYPSNPPYKEIRSNGTKPAQFYYEPEDDWIDIYSGSSQNDVYGGYMDGFFFEIPETKTKFATLSLNYDNTNVPDSFVLNFDYEQAEGRIGEEYLAENAEFLPFNVGSVPSAPDRSLSSLKVEGTKTPIQTYLNQANPTATAYNNTPYSVTISYQDSLQQLTTTATPTKTGVTTTVSHKDSSNALVTGRMHYITGDIIEIKVEDPDESGVFEYYYVTVNVTAANTDNTLSTLNLAAKMGSETLVTQNNSTPVGESISFSVPYRTQTVTIQAVANSPQFAKINSLNVGQAYNGTITMQPGQYSYTDTIVVTAENSTTKTYTVSITREQPSTAVTLEWIKVNGDADSNKATKDAVEPTKYTYEIGESDTTFRFKALPTANTFATMGYRETSSGGAFTPLSYNTLSNIYAINTKGGSRSIDIKVTSEKGTETQIYTLIVSRAKSSSTVLESVLFVEDGDSGTAGNVNDDPISFNVKDNAHNNIIVQGVVQEGGSTALYKGTTLVADSKVLIADLETGDNAYILRVTAANGSATKDYNINIYKKSDANEVTSTAFYNPNDGLKLLKSPDDYSIELNVGGNPRDTKYTFPYMVGGNPLTSLRIDIKSSNVSIIEIQAPSGLTNPGNNEFSHTFSLTGKAAITINLKIRVTAESGAYKDYTFILYREGASEDNTLEFIKIDDSLINSPFKPNQFIYADPYIVAPTKTSVNITAKPNDPKAKAKIITAQEPNPSYGALGAVVSSVPTLVRGQKQTIKIHILSESGDLQEYKFDIIAADEGKDVTGVTLTNQNIPISFSATTLTYELTVPYSTTKTHLIVSASSGAKIEIDENGTKVEINQGAAREWNLNQGVNTRTFRAKSEAGIFSDKTYTIIINRSPARTIAILNNVTIVDSKSQPVVFSFAPTTTSYDIRVNADITNVDFTLTLPTPDNGSKIDAPAASGTYSFSLVEGQVNTVSFTVRAEDTTTTKTYTFNIKRANNNSTVTSVTVNSVTYVVNDTNFVGPNRILTIPNSNWDTSSYPVSFVLEDPKASISLGGSINVASPSPGYTWALLNTGENTFTFKGVAQDGVTETNVYTVKVTKPLPRKVADLENVTIVDSKNQNVVVGFLPNKTTYDLRVNSDITHVDFTLTLPTPDNGSKIDAPAASGTYNFPLTDGQVNTVSFVVRAEDTTTTKTYTFNIKRANNNPTVTSVVVNGVTYAVNDTNFVGPNRILTIPNSNWDTSSYPVSFVLEDPKASISLGGSINVASPSPGYTWALLNTGENTFTFKGVAQDGVTETNVYTVKVTKPLPRKVADLENVTIVDSKNQNVVVGFLPNKTTYDLRVNSDITNVDFTLTLPTPDNGSKIDAPAASGTYSFSLVEGQVNTVSFTVRAEDTTTTKTYTFNIKRANNNSTVTSVTVNSVTYVVNEANFVGPNRILTIPNSNWDTSSYPVNFALEDSKASISLGGSINVASPSPGYTWALLNTGENTFTFKGVAQDGVTETNVYTVKVTKPLPRKVADLENVTIVDSKNQNVVVGFLPNKTTYDLRVNSDITNVDFTLTLPTPDNGSKIDAPAASGTYSFSLVEGQVNTVSFTVRAEDTTTTKTYTFNIKRANNNSTVTSVTVNSVTYVVNEANFVGPNRILTIPNSNWDTSSYPVNFALEDSKASISLGGSINVASPSPGYTWALLNTGENTFTFKGVAQDGVTETNVYTVKVTKPLPRKVADLENVTIVDSKNQNVVVGFLPNKTTYDLRVNSDITHVDFTLTLPTPDNGSKIDAPAASGTYNFPLTEGQVNTVSFIVRAEDTTTTKKYTFNIKRADNIADITSVTINGVNYLISDFDPITKTYTIPNALHTHNSYTVVFNLANSNATVATTPLLGGTPPNYSWSIINTGDHQFSFQATAQDGETKSDIYIVKVHKLAPRDNTELIALDIKADLGSGDVSVLTEPYADYSFTSDRRKYTINLPKSVTSIKISGTANAAEGAVLDNPTDQIGTHSLSATNFDQTFYVTVRAENNSTKSYEIRIVRKSNVNAITNIVVYKTDDSTTTYTLNRGSLTGFDQGTYEYTLDELPFNVGQITFAIETDEYATLGVNTVYPQTNPYVYTVKATNDLTFRVKSETGIEGQSYRITFTRKSASSDSSLSALAIYKNSTQEAANDLFNQIGAPTFASNTYSYDFGVDQTVANVFFKPTANCPYATITGALGTRTINDGAQTFTIKVTAEDGTFTEYGIKITKADIRNSITDILIDGVPLPDFQPTTTTYTLDDVPFSKSTMNINFTVDSTKASKNGAGDKNLIAGATNEYEIWAISEAGVPGTKYTIRVKRGTASTNTLLSALELKHGSTNIPLSPAFSSTQLIYVARVNRGQNNLTISATPADPLSTVAGTGNVTVGDGGTLTQTITVTSEGGQVQNYSLTIVCKNDNNTINEIVLGGITYTPAANFNNPEKTLTLPAVAFSVKNMTVKVNMTDSHAKYESYYTPGNVNNIYNANQEYTWNLSEGENILTLKGISEFGTASEDVYTVKVTQNAADTNNYLSDLIVSTNDTTLDPNLITDFNKIEPVYNVEIARTQANLYIKATKESSRAVVKINGATHTPGSTTTIPVPTSGTITISVTSEVGDTRNYQVVVSKVSYNNDLLSVKVGTHLINETDFDGSNTYTIATPFAYNITNTTVFVKLADKDYAKFRTNIQPGDNPSDQTINYTLVGGENTITITPVSEKGVEGNTYTIKFNKAAANVEKTLSELVVNTANNKENNLIAFSSDQDLYTIRVDRNVTDLYVFARPTSTTSQVYINNTLHTNYDNSRKIQIITTEQTITVRVNNELNEETVYTIKVIRKNDNSDVKEIIIGGTTYTPAANFNNPEKTLTLPAVAFNINKLIVKVNMVDSNTQFESIYSFNTTNATYNTGNTFDWNLDEGENTLTIQGISEYGTKSTDVYTVKVTKNAASTDNELIDLIVSSSNTLAPNFITGFNKDNLTYSIEIPRGFSSLYIKATPSSNKATIKIQNNSHNFNNTYTLPISSDSFTIVVTVTPEIGSPTKDYQVEVTRVSTNNELVSIQVGSLVINKADFVGNSYTISEPFAFNLSTTPVVVKLADKDYAKYKTNIQGYDTGNNVSDVTINYTLKNGDQSFTITPVSEKGVDGETYTVYLSRSVPNEEKTLSELVVNTANNKENNLITSFAPATTLYNIRVDRSTNNLYVFATPTSTTSKVYINGSLHTNYANSRAVTLTSDEQNIVIKVTNELNEDTLYTVKVTRKNDNNNLLRFDFTSMDGTIAINPGDFTLEGGILTYRKTVLYSDTSIAITPRLEDTKGKYKVEGIIIHQGKVYNSGEALAVTLVEGDNTFSIIPISEYGTEGETYRFIITKNAGDTNNFLEHLNIRLEDNKNPGNILALTPVFNQTEQDYILRVDRDTINVFVDVKAVSATSIINVADSTYNNVTENYVFPVQTISQEKILRITVTPEVGSSREYRVKVITKNNIADIDNIVINGFILKNATDPSIEGYDENTLNYKIDNVGSSYVEITVTPRDDFDKIKLFVKDIQRSSQTIQIPVNDGTNTITVYVRAEDNTKGKTYTITFEKALTDYKLKNFKIYDITGGGETLLFEENSVTSYGYEFAISNSVNQVKIVAEPVTPSHTVSGTNTGISTLTKETTFNVTVGPEIGGQKYTFKLTKKDDDCSISSIYLVDGSAHNYLDIFNVGELTYTIEIPYKETSLTLNVVPNSSTATVTGNGVKPIAETGTTIITFFVKAEDGTLGPTYTVNVTRKAAQTSNELDGMEVLVDGENKLVGDLAFNPSKKSYTISVPLAADKALITVTPKEGQTVTGPINVETPLGVGNNNFNITVTPEKGTATAYTISIVKEAPKSDDNTINSVSLIDSTAKNWLADFDAGELTYTIEIPYKETSLTLNVVPNSDKATVVGNGSYPIAEMGVTTITFFVRSEDGTLGPTYTVNVTRKAAQTSNELDGMEVLVDGENKLVGDLAFNPSRKSYTISVPLAADKALITVTPKEGQTVTGPINVETPLGVGNNNFNITVTPEKGTATAYTISIIKEAPKSNNTEISSVVLKGNNGVNYITGPNAFVKEKDLYEITVPYVVNQVDLDVKTVDNKATVDANGIHVLNTYGEGNINFVVFQVEAEDGTLGTLYTIKISRRDPQQSAELLGMEVLVDNINKLEGFTPEDKTYNITVPLTSNFGKVIVTTKEGQTVTGDVNNERPLIEGDNVFNITVIPELGSGTTYIITITKAAPKSDDARIRNVILKDSSGNNYLSHFNKDLDTYEIEVPYKVDTLDLLVRPEHAKATVDANGVHALNTYGEGNINTITFQVEAEDGTLGTLYTVKVTRRAPQDSNELDDIEVLIDGVNKLTNFDPTRSSYVVKVDETVEMSKIVVVRKLGQTVTGDINTLRPIEMGDNKYVITVIPEDGPSRIYNINILKQSSDATIDGIEIRGVETNKNYPLNYPLENTVKVDFADENLIINLDLPDGATLINPKATYPAVDGGTIELLVQAEDGSVMLHVINIDKSQPSDQKELETLEVVRPNAENFTYRLDTTRNRHHVYVLSDETRVELRGVIPAGATVDGLGVKDVPNKRNNFIITVTAENLTEKTYEIIVHKIDNDASLVGININNKQLDDYKVNTSFSPETLEYEVFVPNTSEDNEILVTLDAIPILQTSQVTEFAPFILKDEERITKKILVTAMSGKQLEYTLHFQTIKPGKLINLEVENHLITPTFNENIMLYTLRVSSDITSINIIAEASQGSSVAGDGIKQLKSGLNTFEVYAVDENGDIGEIYTLKVERVKKSRDNTLDALRIYNSEGYVVGANNDALLLPYSPTFSKEILSYVLILPNPAIDRVYIEADISCPKARMDDLGYRNLESEITVIPIRVISETGETRTYQIIVYKEEPVPPLSSQALLTNLTVKGNDNLEYLGENPVEGGIVFDQNTYTYFLEVPANLRDITFTAEGLGHIYFSDEDAPWIYSSGRFDFENRDSNDPNFNPNIIKAIVTVVPENGNNENIKHYKVTIKRDSASGNNNLKDLRVNGVTPADFDPQRYPDRTDFLVVVPYEENKVVVITGIPEDVNAEVLNEGRKVLTKEGFNYFSIQVKAPNGDIKVYTLVIDNSKTAGRKGLDDILGDLIAITVLDKYVENFDPNARYYEIKVTSGEKHRIIKNLDDSVKAIFSENSIYASSYEVFQDEFNENFIIVRVKADNDDTTEYVLFLNSATQTNIVDNFLLIGVMVLWFILVTWFASYLIYKNREKKQSEIK